MKRNIVECKKSVCTISFKVTYTTMFFFFLFFFFLFFFFFLVVVVVVVVDDAVVVVDDDAVVVVVHKIISKHLLFVVAFWIQMQADHQVHHLSGNRMSTVLIICPQKT